MPTCFVVMGFGKKTDYPTGRVLDLDKSYEYIIKPAAQAAGYQCRRADEIPHAGNINVPMYQQLLNADVVIADVSTYNPNAFYELGVRHALKPFTTITIAEDKLVFPFDIGQIVIRKYHHLGEGIDFGEVQRMRQELETAIRTIGPQAMCDSPVYTFLRDLQPPAAARAEATRAAEIAATRAASDSQPTVRALMDEVEAAFSRSDFLAAKNLLKVVRSMMPSELFVIQKLALATYKSEMPTRAEALNEALAILESLDPENSTDAETLGLYGAVHKRLWALTQAPEHLDKAVWAHEKGFHLKNDYYNGINLAFLLNIRAAVAGDEDPASAIADFVLAQRTRRRVLMLCERLLGSEPAPKGAEEYWIKATMAEAYAGLGDEAGAEKLIAAARAVNMSVPSPERPSVAVTAEGVPQWMVDSTKGQLKRLEEVLAYSPLSRIRQQPARQPGEKRWVKSMREGNRHLTVTIVPWPGDDEWFWIYARVTSTDPVGDPLPPVVTYHLDESYDEPRLKIPVVDGEALAVVQTEAPYTLKVQCDVTLKLDLGDISGVPWT